MRARARATSSCTVYVCIFTNSLRSGLIIASCDPLQYYALQRHLRLTCTCIVVRAVRNARQTCRLYALHTHSILNKTIAVLVCARANNPLRQSSQLANFDRVHGACAYSRYPKLTKFTPRLNAPFILLHAKSNVNTLCASGQIKVARGPRDRLGPSGTARDTE